MKTAPYVLIVAAAALLGCPKRVPEEEVKTSGPPRAYQLLQQTPERETTQFEEKRDDVEVESRELDRTPHVVARGETPLIKLDGARARLFGDEGATSGWFVDNFVLIEVLDEKGNVLNRANAGFAQGVHVGAEQIDNVGRMTFQFDPGEVDLTNRLPDKQPFKIRATALDAGGVGRVSDLYVVLDYPATRSAGEDDLRGE